MMHGVLTTYDASRGVGLIRPDDGSRNLGFRIEDIAVTKGLAPGKEVTYKIEVGDWYASRIEIKDAPRANKSRKVAALLAFFGGALGLQKFYLGYPFAALGLMVGTLLFGWLALPVIFAVSVGMIEAFIYLRLSNEEFDRRYLQERRAWL